MTCCHFLNFLLMLFFGLKVSAKLNSALLPLAKFSSDAFHSLVFCHVFVSKRTLFILIGLVFLTISNFFRLAVFLFCIASGVKLSFASLPCDKLVRIRNRLKRE